MKKPLVIAIITTDLRDEERRYAEPNPVFGHAPSAFLQGFINQPDVEIHVLSCVQQHVSSPEKVARNIYYHSIKVGKWGWLRGGYIGCILAIRKKLRQIRPHIVHGHGTERYCAISAAFSGYPNVITIHGNMRLIARINKARPFSFQWLAGRLESFTIPRSQGVVCLSEHTARVIGDTAQSTWIIPNAVAEQFFQVPRNHTKKKELTGVCIATIYPLKNQNNFIRAVDSLICKRHFKMMFLGSVSKNPYTDEFLDLLKTRNWCEYAGFAGPEKLMNYLSAADFLVLPSLEENCPMVVLEAMAAGVPIMASNVGGVPDLIEDGKTGILCNPYDPESLRNKFEQLLENPQLRLGLATQAKSDAYRRFHPDVIAGEHLKVYNSVLSDD